jgi:hypothetical protein
MKALTSGLQQAIMQVGSVVYAQAGGNTSLRQTKFSSKVTLASEFVPLKRILPGIKNGSGYRSRRVRRHSSALPSSSGRRAVDLSTRRRRYS